MQLHICLFHIIIYNCIGKEAAIKLAGLGAHTVLLCKSLDKAEAAIKDIKQKVPNAKCDALQLDLGSQKSIKNCAQLISEMFSKVDVLINNAGVMSLPQRTLTEDNFEAHLGIP